MNKLAMKTKNHVEVIDGKVKYAYDDITRSRGWVSLEEAHKLTLDYLNVAKELVLKDENNSRAVGAGENH